MWLFYSWHKNNNWNNWTLGSRHPDHLEEAQSTDPWRLMMWEAEAREKIDIFMLERRIRTTQHFKLPFFVKREDHVYWFMFPLPIWLVKTCEKTAQSSHFSKYQKITPFPDFKTNLIQVWKYFIQEYPKMIQNIRLQFWWTPSNQVPCKTIIL